MKILVTGASGFIGQHTLPLLQEHEVHAISRRPRRSPYAKFHTCDLLDTTQIFALLFDLKPDVLLHLAWETTPGVYINSPTNLAWLKLSIDLFESFVRAGGRRVVAAGSSFEYGASNSPCKEEETLLRPTSLYGATKASLHQVSAEFFKTKGISFAWGRIFQTYGPLENQERLIPQLIASVGKPFEIRNYHQVKDFIHVEDVAEIFKQLVANDFEGTLNIGTGKGTTLGELGNWITEVPEVESDDSKLVADITKLQEVNYIPRFSAQEGIKQTVEWWNAQL
ncbi:MAG: NAD-dependent epimerase/dehydratase family protein [Chlamydiales bacterium]|nr:NAD-dependent epimerase/dehydratase family protein [Chlamydiales bacterium]